jgi:hypothetical protein
MSATMNNVTNYFSSPKLKRRKPTEIMKKKRTKWNQLLNSSSLCGEEQNRSRFWSLEQKMSMISYQYKIRNIYRWCKSAENT